MTATQCRVCAAPTDAYLCRVCLRELRQAIAELPSDVTDLAAVMTRQASGPLGLGERRRQWEGPFEEGSLGDAPWEFAPGPADQLWANAPRLQRVLRTATRRGDAPRGRRMASDRGGEVKAPLKVEALALSHGAHRDCIDAGPDASCSRCHSLVMSAFDHFYGDLSHERVRTRIAADLAAEGRLTR